MLDNNTFTPNFEFYPLNKTIIDVTRILQGQAALQNIKLEITTPNEEIILQLDQLRLQQVMINLLSNAIKFSNSSETIKIDVIVDKKKSSD